ncbi:hypothetical protein CBF23_010690 [Marinomonas agarivorans]|nr:hypothetical protein CBF23_010690 [Marinomonas agarivorans]
MQKQYTDTKQFLVKKLFSGKGLLLIMFLLTGLPLSIAWSMVFTGWQPSHITAKGQFLAPPIEWKTIANTEMAGVPETWRLLVLENHCDLRCQERLESYRKMHIALGRQSKALSRVLITSVPFASQDPFLYQINASHLSLSATSPSESTVWLADPDGWIVMRFTPDQPAAELHQDILKLLKANSKS